MRETSRATPLGNTVKLWFAPSQPHVEVVGKVKASYRVKFVDERTGVLVYQSTIGPGEWAEADPRYYVQWRITVEEEGQSVLDYRHELKDQPVLVVLNSTALGDTVAWFACVEAFRKKHGCKVAVQTHWSVLFQGNYPELTFEPMNPDVKGDLLCAYLVGCCDNDFKHNKTNWRSVPLQQIASDYLGLDYDCQRPRIVRPGMLAPIKERYVAISEFANGYLAKRWLAPNGWQKLVDYLIQRGYHVVSVSKEQSSLERLTKLNSKPIEETLNVIQHAELFIGCSSGPSILAWALGVPTVIISGFTQKWGEVEGVTRVINEKVCHGCINDQSLPLDRANFNYCPRGKNMVCATHISVQSVIEAISSVLKPAPQDSFTGSVPTETGKRVLFLMPHCSTGGMPQYVVKEVQNLKATVAAAEWQNLSDDYVVQRKRLQALLGPGFHQLNQRPERLFKLIEEFKPDVIHLQEAPELFLPDELAARLFSRAKELSCQLIVTSHNSDYRPQEVKWWPDGFVWVSQFHAGLFQQECARRRVPFRVAEYRLLRRQRPERTEALAKLGLDPRRYHVLNVGLFTPNKNQGEVFEVARATPGVQYHFLGNTAANFASYWQPLLESKPANVKVWGEKENVDDFYSAADLFVFTSKKECAPLAVKEALSWQVPVLLRNLPTYCGAYDSQPLVTFVNGNLKAQICELLVGTIGRPGPAN